MLDKKRFERTIDLLIEQKEIHAKRILSIPDDSEYSQYIKDHHTQINTEIQQTIDDIDDAINTLSAIREQCP